MMPLLPIDFIMQAKAHVDSKLKGSKALKGRALDAFVRPLFAKVQSGSWAYAIALKQALSRRCLMDTQWPAVFKRLVPNEIIEHKHAAKWLDADSKTRGRWLHIPNGESRCEITGARLKAMGVKRGFPDIMIYHPRIIIAQELKRLDGGDTSDDQTHWLKVLADAGVSCDVAYGARHLIDNVQRHLSRINNVILDSRVSGYNRPR
jgi:hypothetical protein